MAKVQVRYNTKSDGFTNAWKVIMDGTTLYFDEVIIHGVAQSETVMGEYGVMKHNLTMERARIDFKDKTCIISPMKREKKFFVITGLPRSRTAWLSSVMSSGRAICFHEPKVRFGSWETFRREVEDMDYDYIGISDSSLPIDPDFRLEDWGLPQIVVVHREFDDVLHSYAEALNISVIDSYNIITKVAAGLAAWLQKMPGIHEVTYEELENSLDVAGIWRKCVGDSLPFEYARCEEMQRMMITQHIEKILHA